MTGKLRVFICHAKEDHPVVNDLTKRLEADGFDIWIDDKNLSPGEEWELEIRNAIEQAGAVIVCLSSKSVKKEGYVQKELRFILEVAQKKPEGTIFILPVRLDECDPPSQITKIQWADYFPEDARDEAYQRLLVSLQKRVESLKTSLPAVACPAKTPDEKDPQRSKVHPDRYKKRKKKKGLSREHKNLLKFFVVVLVTMAFIVLVVLLALKPVLTAITPTGIPSHTPSATATIFPTETASPPPTNTFAPTDPPTPTETFTPVIDATCVQDSIWTPYTTDVTRVVEKNGICWQLSKWGIALYADEFSFLASGFRRGEWYTFSRPVAREVTVTFTLTVTSLNDAEIWVGLAEDVDPARNGVFLVRQSNGLFDIRSLNENGYVWTVSNDKSVDHESGAYTIKFTLAGERMTVSINERMWFYGDIPAPFTSPRLHLGYRPVLNGLINARVTLPQVTEK